MRGLYFQNGRVYISYGMPQRGLDYDDPVLLRESIKLQIVDYIKGEVDHYSNNLRVIFDQYGQISGMVGIDNDQSFGPKIAKANDLFGHIGSSALMLPPVIDEGMYQDVMNISEENLENELNRLLLPMEIEGTKYRFRDLKERFEKLRETGCVIDPLRWEEMVGDPRFNPGNSYIARERARLDLSNPRAQLNLNQFQE